MSCNIICIWLAFVFASACTSWAQTPLSLDEILERHNQALGGKEKLDSIQTVAQHFVYREGTFVMPDAFVARMKPYYKTIGDPHDMTIDVNEGYDGSAWEWYKDPGVVIRTVGDAAAATRHGLDLIDSLVDCRERCKQIALAGPAQFAGRSAYQIHITLADGFEKDVFVDYQSFLIVGDRRSAPIHAFGQPTSSESRFSDYRSVEGVMFPFESQEVDIASGKELNSSTTTSIVINKQLSKEFFGSPQYPRTPLQQFLEQVFMERTDPLAVAWTYREFRLANPGLDTSDGVDFIGYQILKAGEHRGAIELLKLNAADYPRSARARFGLGRAYKADGQLEEARRAFVQTLQIDPTFRKARDGLNALR